VSRQAFAGIAPLDLAGFRVFVSRDESDVFRTRREADAAIDTMPRVPETIGTRFSIESAD
jgi:hypothetical protein